MEADTAASGCRPARPEGAGATVAFADFTDAKLQGAFLSATETGLGDPLPHLMRPPARSARDRAAAPGGTGPDPPRPTEGDRRREPPGRSTGGVTIKATIDWSAAGSAAA